MLKLDPYLFFSGRCKEAFEFYEKCFNGKIVMMVTHADMPASEQEAAGQDAKDLIMHARLAVGDQALMGSDAPPHLFATPQGFRVSIIVDTPAEAERIFAALAEDGNVSMPIAETFWATRFGMVTDRFGTPWMVSCEKTR